MENAMILLYDICRLCLDEPGVDNIFQPVDWSQDIFNYTGVKVTPSDKLPQTICTSCRDIITCAKVLKELAETNDIRLQAIRGSNVESSDDQVLMTDSLSHLVIISTHNPNQNNSTETQEITSSSVTVNESYKSRIIYESDGTKEVDSKTEKQNTKKRKSSFKPENIRTAKLIAVRKDLFETPTVTSSSKTIKSSPKNRTLQDSPMKADDKAVGSSKFVSSTIKSELPSTPSPSKDAGKVVKSETEHVCETCNKSYGTPKKLYLHRLAHNKKYLCPLDTCGKKFATKGDLQKHIRSHTGERPFKCNLCEQSFTQKVSLKAHKENIHNEPLSQG